MLLMISVQRHAMPNNVLHRRRSHQLSNECRLFCNSVPPQRRPFQNAPAYLYEHQKAASRASPRSRPLLKKKHGTQAPLRIAAVALVLLGRTSSLRAVQATRPRVARLIAGPDDELRQTNFRRVDAQHRRQRVQYQNGSADRASLPARSCMKGTLVYRHRPMCRRRINKPHCAGWNHSNRGRRNHGISFVAPGSARRHAK